MPVSHSPGDGPEASEAQAGSLRKEMQPGLRLSIPYQDMPTCPKGDFTLDSATPAWLHPERKLGQQGGFSSKEHHHN